jgi:hypothetical protein
MSLNGRLRLALGVARSNLLKIIIRINNVSDLVVDQARGGCSGQGRAGNLEERSTASVSLMRRGSSIPSSFLPQRAQVCVS